MALAVFGLSRAQLAIAGGLLALSGILAGVVALEARAVDDPLALAAPAAGDAAPQAVAAPRVFKLAPLASFAAVTDRPLFSPDRRPAAAGETLGAWSALSLAGIIVTPDSRAALIAHGNPPKLEHVQEGQAVDGWVVRSIEPDRIVVANGAEEHELRFLEKREEDRAARGAPTRRVPPR